MEQNYQKEKERRRNLDILQEIFININHHDVVAVAVVLKKQQQQRSPEP